MLCDKQLKNKMFKTSDESVNLPEVVMAERPIISMEKMYTYMEFFVEEKSLGFTELLVFISKKINKRHSRTERILDLIWSYFLANDIFIAFVCVILKPCSASRAAPACTSLSNSTKAMSWRPGTRRTSLNPGNLNTTLRLDSTVPKKEIQMNFRAELLTGWTAWKAWVRLSLLGGWSGRGCDLEDFLKPVKENPKWIEE